MLSYLFSQMLIKITTIFRKYFYQLTKRQLQQNFTKIFQIEKIRSRGISWCKKTNENLDVDVDNIVV